jgi:hypothetical protein
MIASKKLYHGSGRGGRAQIIGPAFPPAVALEARLLVIVGTEFVTEE